MVYFNFDSIIVICGKFEIILLYMKIPQMMIYPPTNGWGIVNGLAPAPVIYIRPAINYSKNYFNESENNIGQINNSVPVTFQLENSHFSGNDGDIFPQSHVMIENMPSGLTPVITRQNSQTLVVEIMGKAIHHDKIMPMTVQL